MRLDFRGMKSKILYFLIICLFAGVSLTGCGKKPEEKPQPPAYEKRNCSFFLSDINSSFTTDEIKLSVEYGINAEIPVENSKAVFLIYDSDHKNLTILKTIENLNQNDYSFTLSNGKYEYKQSTVLEIANDFFDKTESEFFISFCLFDIADNPYDHPATGYFYKVKYAVNGDKINFVIKDQSVIRNH